MLDEMKGPTGRSERGASAVEYGLLVVAIAALVVATVFVVGLFVKGEYSNTCDALSSGVTNVTDTCP